MLWVIDFVRSRCNDAAAKKKHSCLYPRHIKYRGYIIVIVFSITIFVCVCLYVNLFVCKCFSFTDFS